MFLALDIGNTHTSFALYDGETLLGDWRVTSIVSRTEDEIAVQVGFYCTHIGRSIADIEAVGISSVVPNLTIAAQRMARKYIDNDDLLVVGAHCDIGMPIRYDDPAAVGADRLCNAVAGYKKYGGPLTIIDFGTANTYDVVSGNGEYLGGVISGGLETAAADLHRRAARLPKIELEFPERVIGTNTVGSMQSGLMFGAVDSITGIVQRIWDELGEKTKVIATGGNAALIASRTPVIENVEPTLVLDGVRLIYDICKKKAR
jgi:type III pantothenate kinase